MCAGLPKAVAILLKQEKRLWRNPKIWLSALAICLVPVLNCVIFTGSLWDPYGRLERMPVALVNLDEGTSVSGSPLNLGKMLS
jgi:putative membrane protein